MKLIYRTSVFIAVILVGSLGFAGLFESQPPKEFMDLKVGWVQGAEGGTTCSVQQFADKGIKADAKKTWEKNATNDWILKVSDHDKVNDTDIKLNFQITRVNGIALIQRVSFNGENIPQIQFMDVLVPIVQKGVEQPPGEKARVPASKGKSK
jgi:hypothetical protein